jgi:hypothetical protein
MKKKRLNTKKASKINRNFDKFDPVNTPKGLNNYLKQYNLEGTPESFINANEADKNASYRRKDGTPKSWKDKQNKQIEKSIADSKIRGGDIEGQNEAQDEYEQNLANHYAGLERQTYKVTVNNYKKQIKEAKEIIKLFILDIKNKRVNGQTFTTTEWEEQGVEAAIRNQIEITRTEISELKEKKKEAIEVMKTLPFPHPKPKRL